MAEFYWGPYRPGEWFVWIGGVLLVGWYIVAFFQPDDSLKVLFGDTLLLLGLVILFSGLYIDKLRKRQPAPRK